tara:strand:+ start:321 stop:728 length:408 start_codon:yes stop_codon:yes gene_type:complete
VVKVVAGLLQVVEAEMVVLVVEAECLLQEAPYIVVVQEILLIQHLIKANLEARDGTNQEFLLGVEEAAEQLSLDLMEHLLKMEVMVELVQQLLYPQLQQLMLVVVEADLIVLFLEQVELEAEAMLVDPKVLQMQV